jgi:hypothetical protein
MKSDKKENRFEICKIDLQIDFLPPSFYQNKGIKHIKNHYLALQAKTRLLIDISSHNPFFPPPPQTC